MKFGKSHLVVIEKRPPMRVDARIYAGPGVTVEDDAVAQLVDAATLPGVTAAIATPDIHQGYGVPIGSVIGMNGAVIPSAVGYDINCGMRLLATSFDAHDLPLELLAAQIKTSIPLGEGKSNITFKGERLRRILRRGIEGFLEVASERGFKADLPMLADVLDIEIERGAAERVEDNGSLDGVPEALPSRAIERGASQFGTLGGGNHFIEIQEVTDIYDQALSSQWGVHHGQAVIMIHSGSRGLGHETAGHFMKLSHIFDVEKGLEHPNRDLAWLPAESDEGRSYIQAMNAAANFAFVNRLVMSLLVSRAFRNATGGHCSSVYDVPHNIAKIEKHGGISVIVHRKGTTRAFGAERMIGTGFAQTGQPVLIPGSMGTSSYLLAGVSGNDVTLCSVNHGAGRVMSRSAATGRRRRGRKGDGLISGEEFKESMKGILLVADDWRSIREEAPAAYKDIDAVIETVTSAGLAKKVARMRPLAVLKG